MFLLEPNKKFVRGSKNTQDSRANTITVCVVEKSRIIANGNFLFASDCVMVLFDKSKLVYICVLMLHLIKFV